MSDLLNRIAIAQRDAAERVVMEDLKAKGIRLTLCPDCGEPTISAAEGIQGEWRDVPTEVQPRGY
jgi:hypothetical protein